MAVVWDHYAWLPAKGDEKKNLAHLVARHVRVQTELSEVSANIARHARAKLTAHRAEGDAEILVEKGRIDRYVILSDERGLMAALSIEYGRKGNEEKGISDMEPLYILTDSVRGLPRKGRR